MIKESFKILKEINSLTSSNNDLEQKISKELDRLTKIEEARSLRLEELNQDQEKLKENKANLVSQENQLIQTQEQIEKAKGHLNNVFTENEIKALNEQISHHESNLNLYEESTLELMEAVENLENSIKDGENYLKGSLETLSELAVEIKEINLPYEQKITSNQARIDNLLTEIDAQTRDKYLKLLDKNMAIAPLAQIENDHCSICKMKLPKAEIEEIERCLKVKSCPSCSRIMIPISSLY